MDSKNGFTISNRDRVLSAWERTMELVRDMQSYSNEIGDENRGLSQLFAEYAEDEAVHAAKLLELLREFEEIRISG